MFLVSVFSCNTFFFGRQEANIISKTGQAPRVYRLYTRKAKILPTTVFSCNTNHAKTLNFEETFEFHKNLAEENKIGLGELDKT